MKWQYYCRIVFLIAIAIILIVEIISNTENFFVYLWVLIAETELLLKDMKVEEQEKIIQSIVEKVETIKIK